MVFDHLPFDLFTDSQHIGIAWLRNEIQHKVWEAIGWTNETVGHRIRAD